MGWCSGTEIFDEVCSILLSPKPIDTHEALVKVIKCLEDGDWDCQSDSKFWDHSQVISAMQEVHPSWFEEE